jgi:DNA-binding beta-propeller fold protein YncE
VTNARTTFCWLRTKWSTAFCLWILCPNRLWPLWELTLTEVAVSSDGRFGYVPIYGNTWVGKPGSNGSTIQVVDLRRARTVAVIDLGKEVRPHCAHFGPDGLLYVSAELANAIYILDTNTRSRVGEIPTGGLVIPTCS